MFLLIIAGVLNTDLFCRMTLYLKVAFITDFEGYSLQHRFNCKHVLLAYNFLSILLLVVDQNILPLLKTLQLVPKKGVTSMKPGQVLNLAVIGLLMHTSSYHCSFQLQDAWGLYFHITLAKFIVTNTLFYQLEHVT